MELLLSNIPPVRLGNANAHSHFEDLLREAEGLRIASGYISADSIVELKKIFEENSKSYLELIIGMHGFDGFTRSQYEATKYLDDYLRSGKFGEVKIVTTFRFHGKIYSFLRGDNSPFATILGSSNLSSMMNSENAYEADLLLRQYPVTTDIDNFVKDLSGRACTPFNIWNPTKFLETENTKLEGIDGVEKLTRAQVIDCFSKRSKILFCIPIKATEAPQSNLNAFFGKGRTAENGYVKPRHWYEVELIVPHHITVDIRYPKTGNIFTVVTDDGWKFNCKVSGDFSKNFRSADDLKILGRWIKGRMEDNNALKMGEPVTDQTLEKYGRNDFELIGTDNPLVWLLNFGIK